MAINSVVGYWSLVVRYSVSELKYLRNDQFLMSVPVAAFGVAGLANDQGPPTNDASTILLSSPSHWYRCTLLQLRFKSAEKRESIGSRARESSKNFVLIQAADFLGRVLNHAFAERNLAVSGHNHAAVAANTQNCSGANQALLGHEGQLLIIA